VPAWKAADTAKDGTEIAVNERAEFMKRRSMQRRAPFVFKFFRTVSSQHLTGEENPEPLSSRPC